MHVCEYALVCACFRARMCARVCVCACMSVWRCWVCRCVYVCVTCANPWQIITDMNAATISTICADVCTCVYVYAHAHLCACVCMCLCLCVCVRVWQQTTHIDLMNDAVCTRTHTHSHTHTHMSTHAHTLTHTHTHAHTHTHTHSLSHTHTHTNFKYSRRWPKIKRESWQKKTRKLRVHKREHTHASKQVKASACVRERPSNRAKE